MMMKCAVLSNVNSEHQTRWGKALADGWRRHGEEVVEVGHQPTLEDDWDVVAMWGTRRVNLIAEAHRKRIGVVILERGYLGNRMEWTSVSLGGGLNGRGLFGPCLDDGQRFQGMAELKPWKTGGHKALIMGQCMGDMSIQRFNLEETYRAAAYNLAAMGYVVEYRPHPLRPFHMPGMVNRNCRVPLEADLQDADVGLTYSINSNSTVVALCEGVPSIIGDPGGSMAYGPAATKFEVRMSTRQPWAARLAWKQWREHEIANGDTWSSLRTLVTSSVEDGHRKANAA